MCLIYVPVVIEARCPNALSSFPLQLGLRPVTMQTHLKQILNLWLLTQRRQDLTWWGNWDLHALPRGCSGQGPSIIGIQHLHQQCQWAGRGWGWSELGQCFSLEAFLHVIWGAASALLASKPVFPAFFKTRSYLISLNKLLLKLARVNCLQQRTWLMEASIITSSCFPNYHSRARFCSVLLPRFICLVVPLTPFHYVNTKFTLSWSLLLVWWFIIVPSIIRM